MPSPSITFDVMLNGRPYVARTFLAPVGGHAHTHVIAEHNGFRLAIPMSFHQGAVIDDERRTAEARIRSFERHNGHYAYLLPRYFSVWNAARLDTAAPDTHYTQPEPALDEDFINKGAWSAHFAFSCDIPSVLVTTPGGDALFEIVEPTLAQRIITAFNARNPDRRPLTFEEAGPRFSAFFTV